MTIAVVIREYVLKAATMDDIKAVNTVLGLNGHVVSCPVTVGSSELKQTHERRLGKWSLFCGVNHILGCYFVEVVSVLSFGINSLKVLFTNLHPKSCLSGLESRHHFTNAIVFG